MISLRLCVMLLMFGVVFAPGPTHAPHATHNPHVQPTIGSGEVDAAIVNVNSHYDDRLCLELLLVDCATHVTKGDEQVCGSNGVTYDNHCRFTHAVCETLHFKDHKITFQSHGACPATTAPLSTASGSVTNATTTSGPATTTIKAPATTDPMGSIVQNVFCSNLAVISCTGGFDVICGSDGQYYPNQCEISKAKCQDATLTIATDTTKCQANVGGRK
ncbi:tomoregulin-2-like [Dreissena polymorpha]|uniref:tomoregulin-2-like n=1 Tax=Dreissena polymorpha TaxID=45954 RepID=UPI002264F776|nr:tomoregulin-2-like [Dreissena polymorpha]